MKKKVSNVWLFHFLKSFIQNPLISVTHVSIARTFLRKLESFRKTTQVINISLHIGNVPRLFHLKLSRIIFIKLKCTTVSDSVHSCRKTPAQIWTTRSTTRVSKKTKHLFPLQTQKEVRYDAVLKIWLVKWPQQLIKQTHLWLTEPSDEWWEQHISQR